MRDYRNRPESAEMLELDGILRLLLIVLSLGLVFCLLRAAIRGVAMFAVARTCGVSRGRIWEVVLQYNEELRAGSLSACDVACAKLFSESTSALVVVMIAGGLIVASLRARHLVKAALLKLETNSNPLANEQKQSCKGE